MARSGSAGGQGPMAYGLHLGARLPLHATSTGRVLLAALPEAAFNAWIEGRELRRLTPRTVVDATALRAVIESVRAVDLALASEEHEVGVHALAVPLRNMRGETVAALNVVASRQDLSPTALQRDFLPQMLEAAQDLRPLL